MKFQDIEKFPYCNYSVHVPWEHLEETLEHYDDRKVKGWLGLNLEPVFQRGHVWNEQQQIDYVEYRLKNGPSGQHIYFNHPNWNSTYQGEMVIVDGKQRLEAVRKFMRNELKVFGHCLNEFEDKLHTIDNFFIFNIASLKNDKDVYRWYIGLNAGGTDHTKEEIEKVRQLLNEK